MSLDSNATKVQTGAMSNISCQSNSMCSQNISFASDPSCNDSQSLLLKTSDDLKSVFSNSSYCTESSNFEEKNEESGQVSYESKASDDVIECGSDDSGPSTAESSTSDFHLLSHMCQDPSFTLLRALQEGYFSDLILTAENGAKFEVHSIILALSFPSIIWGDDDCDHSQKKNVSVFQLNEDSSKVFTFPGCTSKSSCQLSIDKCFRRNDFRGNTQNSSKENSELLGNEGSSQFSISSDEGIYTRNSSIQKKNFPRVRLPRLPEAVLQALLHYAYSESLPENLAPETAELCLQLLSPPCAAAPHTSVFRDLCSSYLRNTALRQDIISKISEIHRCLARMEEFLSIEEFQSMISSEEEEEDDDIDRRVETMSIQGSREKNPLQLSPNRLCTALKQAAREAATVIVLALELCQVYAKSQSHLGKRELREMAQYAASQLAPLASQLDAVLSALLHSIPSVSSPIMLGAQNSSYQSFNGHRIHHPLGEGATLRDRLASHLVSEMETALEVLSSLAISLREDIKEILEKCKESETFAEYNESLLNCNQESSSDSMKGNRDPRIDTLCCVYERISFYILHLLQKKENFSDLGIGGRFQIICQTLDQLSEELPIFLLRLRDTLATIDEQLAPEHLSQPLEEWTSKISEFLDLLSTHRSILQPLLFTLSELVQREKFLSTLHQLKLLNSNTTEDETRCTKSYPLESTTETTYGLSLVRSLITPPNGRRSNLSRRALKLLHTGKYTDMVFQVVLPMLPGCDLNNPPAVDYRDYLGIPQIGNLELDEESGHWMWRVGAHRAIVAARCDWFRRALLSGMKEAINRKIMVHDTTPQLLHLFLQWVYSGQLHLDCSIFPNGKLPKDGAGNVVAHTTALLSAEQLWSLLVLADQLEVDDLKSTCEHLLIFGGFHISDPESTIAYLSLADQVNAQAVRNACLQHISCNPNDVMESEQFNELSSSLQSEVYDRLFWNKPRKSQTTEWLLLTPEDDEDDSEDVKCGISSLNTSCEIQKNVPDQLLSINRSITRDESENEIKKE